MDRKMQDKLVRSEYIKEGVWSATLSTSITNIILAQQTAMIVAITAPLLPLHLRHKHDLLLKELINKMEAL